MKAGKFIQWLNSASLSSKSFMSLGLGKELSEAMAKAYYPKKRDLKSESENSIVKLIQEYDLKEIGLLSNVSFDVEPVSQLDYTYIGWVNGDILAIDFNSNKIVSLDPYFRRRITFQCAESGDKFLDAFCLYGLSDFNTYKNEDEKRTAHITKANEAIVAAGGELYREFWDSLNYEL